MTRRVLLLAALLFCAVAAFGELLEVHLIDVGQGAAVLLRTGEAAVLVDAGRDETVAVYLASVGIGSLDLAVATHAHADHIGGFEHVLRAMPVRRLWYNGQTHTTRTFERFIDAVLDSAAAYHEPSRGEQVEFEKLVITVLHPRRSAADYTGHLHDMNIVVRAEYGEFSVLLTGDAEVDAELEIIRSGMETASTVLKLGHHGSRTSSSLQFLRAVSPALVVYQAAVGNPYGHPHDEVIVRARDIVGAEVYGTDRHGTIRIVTDGTSYRVTTEVRYEVGDSRGCIDINTASVEELSRIIHIGEERARQIVSLRPFRSVDDLVRVQGIGEARLRAIVEQGLVCPVE